MDSAFEEKNFCFRGLKLPRQYLVSLGNFREKIEIFKILLQRSVSTRFTIDTFAMTKTGVIIGITVKPSNYIVRATHIATSGSAIASFYSAEPVIWRYFGRLSLRNELVLFEHVLFWTESVVNEIRKITLANFGVPVHRAENSGLTFFQFTLAVAKAIAV